MPTAPNPHAGFVHIHGVSVGEILSAVPVIEGILLKCPGTRILLTSWTKTSQAQAQRLFSANARIIVDRLPPDLPWKHGPFYRKYDIKAALWIDSEIWPGWLAAMRARNIPAALINGRMSDRSYRRWRKARFAARYLLSRFTRIDAQSAADAERFNALGGAATVQPVNLKYLRPAAEADTTALNGLKSRLGTARRAVIWLSTHDGDEARAMDAHAALKPQLPGLLTVIVPRHPHRVDEVLIEASERGLTAAKRSVPDTHHPGLDLLIGDTIGEMSLYLSLGELVVIGKSFDQRKPGGQSPIEAGQRGRAIVCGPYMTNFPGVMQDFQGADAILETDDPQAALSSLLADPAETARLGAAAQAVCAAKMAQGPAYIDSLTRFLVEAGCA